MMQSEVIYTLDDNGGRRLGIDRRRFSYASHIPERRLGRERRSSEDRRSDEERRNDKTNGLLAGGVSGNRRCDPERRSMLQNKNGNRSFSP